MVLTPLGPFTPRRLRRRRRAVALAGLAPGVHQTPDVFFRLAPDGRVAWVVSRHCDHASGTLALCDGGRTARCPLHGYELDTETLAYRNAKVTKTSLPFTQRDGTLAFELEEVTLEPPAGAAGPPGRVVVRHLAHAAVAFDAGGQRLVTDPWLVGPCFANGWWPARSPRADALDVLRGADVVYVSHNHPDHLHPETLEALPRATPFIVPAFASGSVERPLRRLGFTDVRPLPFNVVHRVDDGQLHVAILRSGDLRDDSGLWLGAGDFTALLTVDSKRVNHLVLPRGVDLLMTEFASGSSGYPLCFEVLPEAERLRIVGRNRRALAAQALDYVARVAPRAYMPYAGMFVEAAPRDAWIRRRNVKNTSAALVARVRRRWPAIQAIDPSADDVLTFDAGTITAGAAAGPPLYAVDDAYYERHIAASKARAAAFDIERVARYFRDSGFRDALRLYLVPTGDTCEPEDGAPGLLVDFAGPVPEASVLPSRALLARFATALPEDGLRHKLVKVRRDPLWEVVTERRSWEELSVGFHCRIDRKPNAYSADFWYHFTNVYTA